MDSVEFAGLCGLYGWERLDSVADEVVIQRDYRGVRKERIIIQRSALDDMTDEEAYLIVRHGEIPARLIEMGVQYA